MAYDFLRQKSYRSKDRATSQNIKSMDTSEHLQQQSFLVPRYSLSPRTAYNDRHYESTHVLERNEQRYKTLTNVSRLPETQVTQKNVRKIATKYTGTKTLVSTVSRPSRPVRNHGCRQKEIRTNGTYYGRSSHSMV